MNYIFKMIETIILIRPVHYFLDYFHLYFPYFLHFEQALVLIKLFIVIIPIQTMLEQLRTILITSQYQLAGHQFMAGHLLHYNVVHLIIHCLLLIALNHISVHFVDPIKLDSHLIAELLFLLDSSLIMLQLCTYVHLNFLYRIRFYFFKENSSSLFIFYI